MSIIYMTTNEFFRLLRIIVMEELLDYQASGLEKNKNHHHRSV